MAVFIGGDAQLMHLQSKFAWTSIPCKSFLELSGSGQAFRIRQMVRQNELVARATDITTIAGVERRRRDRDAIA